MTAGFAVDETYGGARAGSWHPGPIVKSFWTGVRFKRKQLVAVEVWRCERCDFLESYATGGQA